MTTLDYTKKKSEQSCTFTVHEIACSLKGVCVCVCVGVYSHVYRSEERRVGKECRL